MDKRIPDLTQIQFSAITVNDVLPIVNIITDETNKITIDQIKNYVNSGVTDTYVTGFTYQDNTFAILDNLGNTFDTTFTEVTGLTVNGDLNITGTTYSNVISATTYQNLPITTDVFVTGGTYSAGTSTFTNNTGGTFNVSGFYTGETSNVNTLTTGIGLSADTTTGDITIINTDPDQVVVLNDGTNINVTGSYPNFTIDVTGLTDFNTFTTGFTYQDNTFTITDNSGSTFNATFTDVTGLTVNGNLNITGTTYTNVISAATYLNLPITTDVFVTGGTYSSGTATFTNNTGGTFNVSGFSSGLPYTIYKALVSLSGGIFTVTQLENTIGDGSGVNPNDIEWSNPSNGVIRATKTGAFTSSNILIGVENMIPSGVPYVCIGTKSTNNIIQVYIYPSTFILSSTPNFTNLPVEIRIY